MNDLYVAHIGTSIMFLGTKEQCKAHRDEQTFSTDCWKVSDLEAYGESNYSEGWDEGYNSGQDSE